MNNIGNHVYFLQGIFNGLLWMMLIYNLLLFFSLRDKSFLYYVLYVFLTSISMLYSYGFIGECISPHMPHVLDFLAISLILSFVFYVLLMRVFIGSKEKHPYLYKATTIIFYCLVAATPILFACIYIDMSLYERLAKITSIVTYLPVLTILILMFRNGNKLERYFVFGSLALFSGIAILLTTMVLGYNPDDYLYGYQIGVVAQVFIFSKGLTYRYEQMNKETIQSKHIALNSQIDPHFFFNSLSVLTSLVYKDPDKSAEYINQLSKVYRNILDKSTEKLVPLDNELKLLDSYIFLMKIRFGNNVSFAIDILDENRNTAYIPPNTLQLLVENAIKHNICSSKEPLAISISEDSNHIYVENTVNRRSLVDENSGIGLKNIQGRFTLLGNKRIEVRDINNKFSVVIPKYNRNDYGSINI